MSGPIERVHDLVAATMSEDELPDSGMRNRIDQAEVAGRRAARAEFRARLMDALEIRHGDDLTFALTADFAGVIVGHGNGSATLLRDSGHAQTIPDLPPITRRIMAARLRAWADEFDAEAAS